MIELIYGEKGTGKTKKIIDSANMRCDSAKGNIVFVSDKAKYSLDINNDIRFVVTAEYAIAGENSFIDFIKGILAANSDICNIYIDGVARIISKAPEQMEGFMLALEHLSVMCDVDFTITISTAEIPKFMKRYI